MVFVEKTLFRMFAIDLNKVRSVVIEGLDVDKQDKEGARNQLAKRALWEIIQTCGKMREFYGGERHYQFETS